MVDRSYFQAAQGGVEPPKLEVMTLPVRDRGPNVCDWCLEYFDSVRHPRTQQELGAIKTKLMIPDAHVPHICPVCFQTVMDAPLFGAIFSDASIRTQGNRTLLCY